MTTTDDARPDAGPIRSLGFPCGQCESPVHCTAQLYCRLEKADDARHGDAPAAGGAEFQNLRSANAARQIAWCAGGDPEPDLAFRGVELAGEVGEALNVIKKLERERRGWRGSRDTVEHLAEELADVVICADLAAMSAGIDLDAAVRAKFNATSAKVGLPHRMTTALAGSAPAAGAVPAGWRLVPEEATAEMVEALGQAAAVNGYRTRGAPLCWSAMLHAAPQPPAPAGGEARAEVAGLLDVTINAALEVGGSYEQGQPRRTDAAEDALRTSRARLDAALAAQARRIADLEAALAGARGDGVPAELRELSARATPGECRVEPSLYEHTVAEITIGGKGAALIWRRDGARTDADLLAALWNDLRARIEVEDRVAAAERGEG